MKKTALTWMNGRGKGGRGGVCMFTIGYVSAPCLAHPYELYCHLPGEEEFTGRFQTEGMARLRAEQVFESWARRTGLTPVESPDEQVVKAISERLMEKLAKTYKRLA